MCGQVKHAKIFSSIVPDLKLVKLLASIETKNTEGLIGAVIKVLKDEGIELVDSTLLLKDLLAPAGVLTRRKPSADEERDIDYGRRIAAALSEHDIGQSVAIAERACVAVEAMEGTDAMLRRAASLVEGKPLRLVKGSRRRKHMLYDVPVIGPQTIAVMRETGTTALSIDAGRTLLLDRAELLRQADAAQIAIVAHPETQQRPSAADSRGGVSPSVSSILVPHGSTNVREPQRGSVAAGANSSIRMDSVRFQVLHELIEILDFKPDVIDRAALGWLLRRRAFRQA